MTTQRREPDTPSIVFDQAGYRTAAFNGMEYP